MKLKEISKPITSDVLNENAAKVFGQRIDTEKFTLEQLQDVRNRIRTNLSQIETNESFDVIYNDKIYQKNRLFLDVLNTAIAERENIDEADKPDFLDLDKDGDKKEPMKKAAADKKDDKDTSEKKGLTAKQKKLPPALQKAIAKKNESVVKEGEEDKAELVMAAKDMVDRITSWMEDTAEMQSESMLELGDAIRDELGQQQSESFIGSVKPSLEALYGTLETTRTALTQGVAMLTGEAEPQLDMGDSEPVADMDMEPLAGDEESDDFEASEPAIGGDEAPGRTKRESLELSRQLGQILSSKKK
tara:strand:+ start:665 stop:1573 length:909 start_codon:yes stop_codon:yes gene_type:complete